MEKIEISTVAVRIRVIEVGGKKMTISVFNQIQDGYFFDDKIPDEERKSQFLGWVSHKGKRYILFYRDGGLFTDEFFPETPDTGLRLKVGYANDRYSQAIRAGCRPEALQNQKNEIDAAKAKLDAEIKRCETWNKRYVDLFTNETQIYIAI